MSPIITETMRMTISGYPISVEALKAVMREAGLGGLPRWRIIIDVRDAIVVWQSDGEVKTLRRKP